MVRKTLILGLILFILIKVFVKYNFVRSIDKYANSYELSIAEPYLDIPIFPQDIYNIKVRSGVDPSFINIEFESEDASWCKKYDKASFHESEKLKDSSFLFTPVQEKPSKDELVVYIIHPSVSEFLVVDLNSDRFWYAKYARPIY